MSSPEGRAEGEVEQYTDAHRAFLQCMLARQKINLQQAKPILAQIFALQDGRDISQDDIGMEELSNFVVEVNDKIEQFHYEIVATYPQTARSRTEENRIYLLVNTQSDQFVQLATMYSADEIAYLKRVLDAMFETFNTPTREVMAITSLEALKRAKAPRSGIGGGADDDNVRESMGDTTNDNTTSNVASLTQKQAEQVLDNLVLDDWFSRSRAGYYTLTPRALIELRHWLKDAYNDTDAEEDEWQPIKDCNACREIVTIGQRCDNVDCNCRLHAFCASGMFQNMVSKECPLCKAAWDGTKAVGEKAARTYRESGGGDGGRPSAA